MTVMLVRLAFAGIRSRLLASALTIAIAAAAVATIVLSLEVRRIQPHDREASPAGIDLRSEYASNYAAGLGRLPPQHV